MGRMDEGSNNKRGLSKGARQAKVKNRHKSNIDRNGDRPRDKQGLSPPI